MKQKVIVLALIIGILMLGGCGKNNISNNGTESAEFSTYPVAGDYSLTYWMSPNPAITSLYETFGETEFAKELEKKTGVKVTYIHPVSGQEEQSLSLMIASDELPDLIEYNWSSYQGGAQKNIDSGVILSLNDLIKTNAPNLSKFLSENEDIDKMVKTDNGDYYVFPFIRKDKLLLKSTGLQIRRDWLEELNLKVPETVDELENVLREFKVKKSAAAPISCKNGQIEGLLNIFGATDSRYVDNGQVKYGPMSENYKEAVIKLRKWYSEGLLDENFASNDSAALNAGVLNDRIGVVYASGGSNLGTWLGSAENTGKKFDMVGIANPLSDDGKVRFFETMSKYPGNGSVAITAGCANPELAAFWLDYAYGEEGSNLFNFGIEQKSYTIENGVPTYTDEIYKNPDGLTVAQAMGKYFRSSWAGPFVQSENYIKQYYTRPQQKESLENWLKYYDDVSDMVFPAVSYTVEEASERADIMNEISKYVSKMRTAFILSSTDISEYDKFIKTIEDLNISRALEIDQAAMERYLQR